ncbi:MAG: SocA family protein [Planctomycetes bacterium]|nr:SocA family protein [Planctomycetota bacterium]
MRIRFQFDPKKAIACMVDILRRSGGECDKVKLMKLLYLADREHFLREGYPITGDSQVAMKHGPVPSNCLDLLDGQVQEWREAVVSRIQTDDYHVRLRPEAVTNDPALTDSERRALDDVFFTHGAKETWSLVDETHRFPEFQEACLKDTSAPIPYETILKHHGGEDRFRHGRAVISHVTMRHMVSPFRVTETDL